MSFLPDTKANRTVPPDGDSNAPICIISDAPGAYEVNDRKLFVGPSGRILEQCLHSAGLIRGELYITSVINHKITSVDRYYNDRTHRLTEAGKEYQPQLLAELKQTKANIFVPLGNLALAAITNEGGIMNKRGYVDSSSLLDNRKILPTIHPSTTLRGNYLHRHFIISDFRKVAEESNNPFITYPDVEINIPETYDQIVDWLNWLNKQEALSIDIEVMYFECSCIGFCWEPNKAVVIPLYNDGRYTLDQEIIIWDLLSQLMYNDKILKIGQNFIFDMQFLLQKNNIITRGIIQDTMIMNSLFHPDFPKGLEFLVSIHCNRPRWKNMVKWKGADIVKRDN